MKDDLLLLVVELGEAGHSHVQGQALDVEGEHIIGGVLEVRVEDINETLDDALTEGETVSYDFHELGLNFIDDLLPHLLLAHDLDVVDVEEGFGSHLPVDLVVGGGDGFNLECNVGEGDVREVDVDAKGSLDLGVEVKDDVSPGKPESQLVGAVVDKGQTSIGDLNIGDVDLLDADIGHLRVPVEVNIVGFANDGVVWDEKGRILDQG